MIYDSTQMNSKQSKAIEIKTYEFLSLSSFWDTNLKNYPQLTKRNICHDGHKKLMPMYCHHSFLPWTPACTAISCAYPQAAILFLVTWGIWWNEMTLQSFRIVLKLLLLTSKRPADSCKCLVQIFNACFCCAKSGFAVNLQNVNYL